MPLPLYLALAHVRRRVLQSALTIAGVAVGVAVLILALSLTNGFIDELLTSTLRATPHLTLRSYLADGRMPDDGEVRARIEGHEDVRAVAPFLAVEALIARRADASLGISGRQGYTQLLGIVPDLEDDVLELGALADAAPMLDAGDGIVLGGSLALDLGVMPGDPVLVQDIAGNRARLVVADTFRVGNELIDGLVSYAALPAVQAYVGAGDRISGYHVRLSDPGVAEEVGRELADATGLRAISWSTLFGGLVTQLRLQKAVISVVVFLIVLRALGARQRQVLATFTLEGALLGGTGTLLGVGLGIAAATYFRVQPFPLPGDLYFISQLPVEIAPFDVAWVAALSLATSAVAGLLPARRAARLDPTEVLR
ncbi:MAG: FtsX-like permease family protein [Deinococcus-Thermus bacterium]|nr:FtsX-like permease family protein [Deinococcota bacterium]